MGTQVVTERIAEGAVGSLSGEPVAAANESVSTVSELRIMDEL